MTDKDKKHLAELRDQGYTYQQIAEASGIGLSSVKMFFKRNNTPADDSGLCAQCKKRLEKDAPKKKRFCSEKCRIKWWAEHPEQLSNAREHQYKCPFCGKVFYSYKPAKFCSLTCYHRSRQKAGEKDV
jgi:rRNA maturation endonuclease Nob1